MKKIRGGRKQALKILVVDDEPAVCDMLKKFLTKKGHKVTIALSGEEAIKKTRKERPWAMFLDIRMPGMSGIDVLKKVKEFDEKICIIMITAVRDDVVGRKCMKWGAFDYITKPLSLEYLEDALIVKLLDKEKG